MTPSPPAQPDETLRLKLLASLDLMRPDAAGQCDDMARLAAVLCGTPVALVALLDADWAWAQSAFGTAVRRTARGQTLCHHAITTPQTVTVVPDVASDRRFGTTAYCLGIEPIRFYAGAPLVMADGNVLGTLCVLDRVPRQLSATQTAALAMLAAAVVDRIQQAHRLCHSEAVLNAFLAHSGDHLWVKGADRLFVRANPALAALLGTTPDDMAGKTWNHFRPLDPAHIDDAEDDHVMHAGEVSTTVITGEGQRHWRMQKFPITAAGQVFVGGIATEITGEIEKEQALQRHDNFLTLRARLVAVLGRADNIDALALDVCRLAASAQHLESVDIRRVGTAAGDPLRLFITVDASSRTRCWDEQVGPDQPGYAPELAQQARVNRTVWFSNDLAAQPDGGHGGSFLAVPLLAGADVWGVLCLYSRRRNHFDKFLREHMSAIGIEIGNALQRLIGAEQMRKLVYLNPFTGLPTRVHFEERLTALAADGHAGTVILLNVNRLDEITSAYGNPAWLGLLRKVAERLATVVEQRMLLSYAGFGRFALFLPDPDNIDVHAFIGATVLPMLSGEYHIDGHRIWCSVNAGAARMPADGAHADVLLARAWEALAGARAGGAGFALYHDGASHPAVRGMLLESELRQAIRRREFVVHYQPKIDLRSGAVSGAEALLRWSHPQRGLLAPDAFIGVLEQSGLIVEVGRQVLSQAMLDWRAWHDAGLAPPPLAVNVAPAQFMDDRLVMDVGAALALAGPAGPACRPLALEITESSLMAEQDRVAGLLNRIRALGVPVAIDDFGTGYSSLSYLAELPLDTLKIDRSFVKKMVHDARSMRLVSTIVKLAHHLGLTLVAEGIETEQEADLLRLLGCEQGQGFLYRAALPAAEFGDYLQTQRQLRAVHLTTPENNGAGPGHTIGPPSLADPARVC